MFLRELGRVWKVPGLHILHFSFVIKSVLRELHVQWRLRRNGVLCVSSENSRRRRPNWSYLNTTGRQATRSHVPCAVDALNLQPLLPVEAGTYAISFMEPRHVKGYGGSRM